MNRSRKAVLVFSMLGLCLVLSRCGKNSDYTSGTFGSVYNTTLKTACIQCHVPSGAATVVSGVQLDFSSQDSAYTTLTQLNVTSTSSSSICSGVKIVKAGNPAQSYLAAVLISTYYTSNFAGVSGCTPYNVHLQNQSLSDAEKTSLVSWIQNGAPND